MAPLNCIFFVVYILFCLALAQTPPSWGGNLRYTVRVKMTNNDPAAIWNFTYLYDWRIKAERYEHEKGQQD